MGQNAKCKKVAQFRGETFLAHDRLFWRPYFPPKSAPSSGKSRFSMFDLGLEFLQVPVAQNPSKSLFATTWGGRPKQKLFLRKLQKIIPDTVLTFFLRFWDPFCSADQKGPCGANLLLAACLLDAQAPPWWSNTLIDRLKYCVLQLGDPYLSLQGLTLTLTHT